MQSVVIKSIWEHQERIGHARPWQKMLAMAQERADATASELTVQDLYDSKDSEGDETSRKSILPFVEDHHETMFDIFDFLNALIDALNVVRHNTRVGEQVH